MHEKMIISEKRKKKKKQTPQTFADVPKGGDGVCF